MSKKTQEENPKWQKYMNFDSPDRLKESKASYNRRIIVSEETGTQKILADF